MCIVAKGAHVYATESRPFEHAISFSRQMHPCEGNINRPPTLYLLKLKGEIETILEPVLVAAYKGVRICLMYMNEDIKIYLQRSIETEPKLKRNVQRERTVKNTIVDALGSMDLLGLCMN